MRIPANDGVGPECCLPYARDGDTCAGVKRETSFSRIGVVGVLWSWMKADELEETVPESRTRCQDSSQGGIWKPESCWQQGRRDRRRLFRLRNAVEQVGQRDREGIG